MSYTQAYIKDTLKRIEQKVDKLLELDRSDPVKKVINLEQPMTAAERMAHARSFRKDKNTGEEGRG